MNNKICYLNGSFITERNASIGLSDLGFLRGYGVFDFLRTYGGNPFLLKEHIKRLRKSANLMNINLPMSDKDIAKVVLQIVKNNNVNESTIRCVLTGGISKNGLWSTGKPTLLITTEELKPVSDEIYQGVKLITDNYLRHKPEAKTIDYSNLVEQQKRIEKEKAFTLLYVNDGFVLEAAISNFFIIKNGIIITPKENILKGTIRNLLIKLVSKNYRVEQRPIGINELKQADEAFITGTTQGVVPVVKIDKIPIGNGCAGVITKRFMDVFFEYIKGFKNN